MRKLLKISVVFLAIFLLLTPNTSSACPPLRNNQFTVVRPPQSFAIVPYAKYVQASGVAVLADPYVCDRSLEVTAEIINHMLSSRPDIQKRMAEHGARVLLFSNHYIVTDLPEFADARGKKIHNGTMNFEESCGITGRRKVPALALCEKILTPDRRHPVRFSTLIHEMGHLIDLQGLDEDTRQSIDRAYMHATEKNLFPPNNNNLPSYAMSTRGEYFAMATGTWFNSANWHNPVNSIYERNARIQAQHDPEITAILQAIYPTDYEWVFPEP